MADRIIKSDSGNDTVIQNNSGSRKIEVTNSGNIEFVGNLAFTSDTDSKIKLPSAGGIFESDGSTEILTESSGAVSLKNTAIDSTVTMSANQAAVKTAINASGSAPIYAVRAWVQFDGTGTPGSGRGNGNVSSVGDNGGVGDYTINFTTAMPDANYACFISGVNREITSSTGQSFGYYSTDNSTAATYTASAVRVTAKDASSGVGRDLNHVSVLIVR